MPNQLDAESKNKIIDHIITAPSGDNCQPQVFRWADNCLEIYHDYELDKNRKFNFGNMGAVLAVGSTMGILRLTARSLGYDVTYELDANFGLDKGAQTLWLRAFFTRNSSLKLNLDLLDQIKHRHVNREFYQGGAFTDEIKKIVTEDLFLPTNFNVSFLQFDQLPKADAEALLNDLSFSESMALQDQVILEDVGKWVRLTRSTSERTRDGMHWSQLGMTPFDVPVLFILRKFPSLVKGFFNSPAGAVVRGKTKQSFKSSAGLAIVWGPEPGSHKNIMNAGDIGVQLWVKFNSQNWGVHPATGLSTFISFVTATQNQQIIPTPTTDKAKHGLDLLRKLCGKQGHEWPLWMFRVGRANPLPKTKISLRRDVKSFIRK